METRLIIEIIMDRFGGVFLTNAIKERLKIERVSEMFGTNKIILIQEYKDLIQELYQLAICKE